MTKKRFCRVLPLLLVLCILFSTTAFAATTYYIEVTLTGPDGDGVTQTITGQSSKYGSLSSPLAYEVVQVIHANLDTIETVYARTGLRQTVYNGLEAFAEGEEAWNDYNNLYYDAVTGDFKDTLRSLDSTFGDLTVNVVNKISYQTQKGTVYVVTVTLRQYQVGSGGTGIDCPRNELCPAGYLTDVDLHAWYHDGIHYCVEHGLMEGYPNCLFGPDDQLTRAQIAQVLYNRENKPEVEAREIFDDVATYAWYADAITWASDAGVVQGYGDGNFGPDDPITREQLAAMLYRYSAYKGYDVSSGEAIETLSFSDADSISDWALSAVKWAYAEGIVEGLGNGILNPTGYATRAQAATMFMRYCLYVVKG